MVSAAVYSMRRAAVQPGDSMARRRRFRGVRNNRAAPAILPGEGHLAPFKGGKYA